MGLKRAGFSRGDLRELKTAYRHLFSSDTALATQIEALAVQDNPHVQLSEKSSRILKKILRKPTKVWLNYQ